MIRGALIHADAADADAETGPHDEPMRSKQIFFALLFLAAFAALAYVLSQQSGANDQRAIDALRARASEGDIATLADEADAMLQSASSQSVRDAAQGLSAYATFLNPDDQKRLAAVQIARERYLAAKENNQRAQAIDQLIQFVVAARTHEMYEAVFAQPPFLVHRKEGDYAGSIASLAKESYNSRPSVISAAYQLLPNLAALTNWDREYELTEAERARHVRIIEAGLPLLDIGLEKDMALVGETPGSAAVTYTHHRWVSHIYGRLALEDAAYVSKAHERYEAALAFYESTKRADGTYPPILLSRFHEVRVSYAAFLIALGGENNLAKAQSLLTSVAQIIERNPQAHEGGYLSFLRSVAAGNTVTRDADLALLQSLADAHPPFGAFIRKYGVVLP